jgi:membrane protein DedA with SNARE-associated domain
MRRAFQRHPLAFWLCVAGLIAAVGLLVTAIDGGDALSALDREGGTSPYLVILALVAGDAVIPVLPGETTLNTASTLAAQGSLDLSLVIAAGAIGAITGDSALFWIARRSSEHVAPTLERARANEKVRTAMGYLDANAPLLIVGARYVPGARFVVNATMGLSDIPYLRFLFWSVIGGVLWSVYTCLLAYWVGSTLIDYPVASLVLSGVLTTAFICIAYVVMRRRRRARDRAGDQLPA